MKHITPQNAKVMDTKICVTKSQTTDVTKSQLIVGKCQNFTVVTFLCKIANKCLNKEKELFQEGCVEAKYQRNIELVWILTASIERYEILIINNYSTKSSKMILFVTIDKFSKPDNCKASICSNQSF